MYVSGNSAELYSSDKNKCFAVTNFLPSVININEIKTVIPSFKGSYFQIIDNCIRNFDDVTVIFNVREM